MSGIGKKRKANNAFNSPSKNKLREEVVNKVFNNQRRVQQLIMNYKNYGGLNENIMGNMFSGSKNLYNMYKSLTINQQQSVINSINFRLGKMLNI